jgi:LPXTG-motif cell wall-anchored protein
MEPQTGPKKTSTLTWVIIGILTLGAGTLIFWLVFMMLFRKGI